MKKYWIVTVALSVGIVLSVYAQKSEIVQTTRYAKTIEKNLVGSGQAKSYNVAGKTLEFEKHFFGDFNAPVEFFYSPSFDGAAGFRIYRDSTGANILEVKHVPNWGEVNTYMNKTYYSGGPAEITTITLAQWEEQVKQGRIREAKRQADRLSRYRIDTTRIVVSDTLADAFHVKFTEMIRAAQKELKMDGLIADGYSSILRCVVGDELWTLDYHIPEGDFKKLSDLCREMITDAEAGTFDEVKYLEELNRQ